MKKKFKLIAVIQAIKTLVIKVDIQIKRKKQRTNQPSRINKHRRKPGVSIYPRDNRQLLNLVPNNVKEKRIMQLCNFLGCIQFSCAMLQFYTVTVTREIVFWSLDDVLWSCGVAGESLGKAKPYAPLYYEQLQFPSTITTAQYLYMEEAIKGRIQIFNYS